MNRLDWLKDGRPPVPENEEKRLSAMKAYFPEEEDLVRHKEFDRLASLAAQICDVPISFINLIGDKKEYKKACYGFEGETTAREVSFCQYTIMGDDLFEVKNVLEDPHLKDNPNVTGGLKLRYYAGIPLRSPEGYNVGSLCLIDHKPNELSSDQKGALETLAEEIVSRFELNAAKRKLERLNHEKDQMVRAVSHDLRNPLFGIIGFAEFLISEMENSEHREILEHIENAGKSMLGHINLLLNTGYLNNESIKVNLVKKDVVAVAEEIISLHRPYAILKNVNLIVEHPPELICKIDPEKWKQIVGNLVGNAIKFTHKGGTVKISLSESGNVSKKITLRVTDSGIGMTQEMIQKLFKLDGTIQRHGTEGEETSGLGMRIIKKNIELLRGTVDVESTHQKGTSFTVKIPI